MWDYVCIYMCLCEHVYEGLAEPFQDEKLPLFTDSFTTKPHSDLVNSRLWTLLPKCFLVFKDYASETKSYF